MRKVLVTGGSGFVAGHCLIQLLNEGFEVRTTVRNLKREAQVRDTLKKAGITDQSRLTIFAADLTQDAGWAEAINGCDFVLHVASPFPTGKIENEDEILIPARDGAVRILKFARDAKVKRVVMTSSFAAVGYGYPERDRVFTELDWANTSAALPPYIKSKAVAEKAAWDFVKREGRELEFTVFCPTGIFGPALNADLSGSIELVQSMLNGKMAACPEVYFGVVDVRDVAALHILAMTKAEVAGQRYILTGGGIFSLLDVATALRKNLGDEAKLAPERELPSDVLSDSNIKRRPSNQKASDAFRWKFREFEKTIADTGRSLVKLGLIK